MQVKGRQKAFLMLPAAPFSMNLANHSQNCVMTPAKLDFIFVYQF
jgi:hypothetical protein